ncbi:MAG: alpha/beta fold hydrolase [Pirellulales bacterium]|nr:alpha/beta fold hydrolase [Pirellulales bacterium]
MRRLLRRRSKPLTAATRITVEPLPPAWSPEAPDWRSLYPFASRWLLLGRRRLHYIDEHSAGAERTLLFVHGNPTWSFHWRRLIGQFRDEYRCVALDHLGCGLSDLQPRSLRLADHIANLGQLVESLDLRRVTLVAQDWGGAIGLGALLAARTRFERIVLFNAGAFRPWFIPFRIRVCRWPVVGRLAVQGGNAFSRAAQTMTLARRRNLDPAVAAGYLAPYGGWRRRAAVHQFVRDIPLTARHPSWSTLGQIEDELPQLAELPALLVWGEQDWCFTPECLDRFVRAWPAAEVHRLADVGHWVVEDAPDEASARLADFLSRS